MKWNANDRPVIVAKNASVLCGRIMFVLTEMRSVVRLEASDFDRELTSAVGDCLNNKLSNKILKDVGLVISLWDIIDVGASFIMPGSSGSHTKVHFRSV